MSEDFRAIRRMQAAHGDPDTGALGYNQGNEQDPLGFSPAAEPVPDEGPVGVMGPDVGPVGSFTTPGLDAYDGQEAALAFDSDGTTVDPTDTQGLDYAPPEFTDPSDTAAYDASVAEN